MSSLVYMICSVLTAFIASTVLASQITAFEAMLSPYHTIAVIWFTAAGVVFIICAAVFLKLRLKKCKVRPFIISGFILSVIFITAIISYLIKIDSMIIHMPGYLSLDAYAKIRGGTIVYWAVIFVILFISDVCAKKLASMIEQGRLKRFIPLYNGFISILKKMTVSVICCAAYSILSAAAMRLCNLASTIIANIIIHIAICAVLLIKNLFNTDHSRSVAVNIIWLLVSLVIFMFINLYIKAIFIYIRL